MVTNLVRNDLAWVLESLEVETDCGVLLTVVLKLWVANKAGALIVAGNVELLADRAAEEETEWKGG